MTTKLSLSDEQVTDILTCLRNKLAEIRKALSQNDVGKILDMAVLMRHDDNIPEFNLVKQFMNTKKLHDYIELKYQNG
jgi:hypothetical protein